MGLYEYVRGGPITAVDPSGLQTGWQMQRELGGWALPSSSGAGCGALRRALPIGIGVGVTVIPRPWNHWDDVIWEDGIPVVPVRPARPVARPAAPVIPAPGGPSEVGQKCPESVKWFLNQVVKRACNKGSGLGSGIAACKPDGTNETAQGCLERALAHSACAAARLLRQRVCFTPDHEKYWGHEQAWKQASAAAAKCYRCFWSLSCRAETCGPRNAPRAARPTAPKDG
jgi:hypothetical protein